MKQGLILNIIVSLFVLTIQTVIPTNPRFKKCPCGRGGPFCNIPIPIMCPRPRITTNLTTIKPTIIPTIKPTFIPTIKPTYKPIKQCLKGFLPECKKNKIGIEICSCRPIFYNKNKEINKY